MGLIDDKKNIFTQIGAYNSIKEKVNIPDLNSNSISSINNTKEIIPYLLDLLVVLVGSEVLKTLIGELMTGFIRGVEPELKTELKKQFSQYNSDQLLSNNFTSAGYSLNMKDIDLYGKLKTDPASQVGSLLYNNKSNDFDNKLYNSILNAGTDVTFNNMTLNYNDTLDKLTIKPLDGNQTIGNFVNNYIDGLNIIDEKQFTASVIDRIFGTITINQNKTLQQTIAEEKLNNTIDKIINDNQTIDISNEELRDIENNAKKRNSGIQNVDLGCGTLRNILTLDSLQNLIKTTTGSTDPTTVGNAYINTVMGGFNSSNPTQAQQDNQTIKDGFFKKLIKSIVSILVGAITTPPQIRALLGIFSGFKNNDIPNIGNPINDIKNNQNLITCLSNKVKSTINEFIFNLVKKELIALIIPVTKTILKEKINQYLAIIRSLISFT